MGSKRKFPRGLPIEDFYQWMLLRCAGDSAQQFSSMRDSISRFGRTNVGTLFTA
jgi:hypothetical protein